MSQKPKTNKTPAKKSQKTGEASPEESLSNLSAIISTEKDTKFKRLHEAVLKRIEGLKGKKPT